MKNVKLAKAWDSLQSSYWFLPSLMALAGMLLAVAMLALDQSSAIKTGELSWIYQGGPDGARGLLSAVASSMVTVAATAFSITIVALQLAASNFGPRLLRNFMRDTGNQIVLGTFIATFLYCLLVLRTIHGEDYNLFVPQLSTTVGIGLAIASIGVLIYFIHHASTIIQASHVIASVAEELDEAIDRLFPEAIGRDHPDSDSLEPPLPQDFDHQARPIHATESGYLQIIDDEQLLQLAGQFNLLLRLTLKPGAFVIIGTPLLLAYPGERVTPKFIEQVNQAFLLGNERTEQQDIEFPINQLVEIALRALSPGINDPFTAIRCIDRLSAALVKLVQRPIPSAYRYDAHRLRVIAEPVPLETLIDAAFNQIRRYAVSDVAVSAQLLHAIGLVMRHTNSFKVLFALRQQAEAVIQCSQEQWSDAHDRQLLEAHYRDVLATLETRTAWMNSTR